MEESAVLSLSPHGKFTHLKRLVVPFAFSADHRSAFCKTDVAGTRRYFVALFWNEYLESDVNLKISSKRMGLDMIHRVFRTVK